MFNELRGKKVAFLGAGKMGGIILQALLKNGLLSPKSTFATVAHPERAKALATKLKVMGVEVATMGISEPQEPEDEVIQFSDAKRGTYKKLIVRDGRLVGGIYGVAIGGFFAGESMFHRVGNASKVALYHLIRQLRSRGFVLFDVQLTTPLTRQLGAIKIPREEYLRRLAQAVEMDCVFESGGKENVALPTVP